MATSVWQRETSVVQRLKPETGNLKLCQANEANVNQCRVCLFVVFLFCCLLPGILIVVFVGADVVAARHCGQQQRAALWKSLITNSLQFLAIATKQLQTTFY